MTNKVAQAYTWLRGMSGGKLLESQVVAGDAIIASCGFETFAKLINFTYTGDKVSGQWDISKTGFDMIKYFEGIKLTAYLDTGGVWTIGYGTIKYPDGTRVKKGDVITKEQAEAYMVNDTKWVDACLDKLIKVKVNQNQFDALASFVYNIGESQFSKSTMLALLNQGASKAKVAEQFDRWVYDNGKRIQGLANRRAKEKSLFLA